ncbi:LytR/AlgR family response regulator transcription factor [Enterococcus faecium]|uniref:LytR/AlgR family response regulator transcription factor n=1 Tax=Enterococcus faecium TaxID=1352 RepID=UPI000CF1EB6C|nr:LytTR family DNA-binding domain-containing protein [Enterococcus faecium]PQD87123.1 DNA-binding response regulator [Enterococcus faecium]
MLKAAICDDELGIANYVGNLLQNYDPDLFEPYVYYDLSKLIKQMDQLNFDIYILDIEFPGKNGMEVADFIRQNDFNVPIIFLTSYREYMEEVFKLHTFDYILKPLEQNYFFQVIERAIKYLGVLNNKFEFSYRKTDYRIALNDILFFEKNRRQVFINMTSQNKYVANMSTSEIIAKLPSTFVQTHTSFIINMEHIREIGKNYVRLSNCENIIELPISRKFKTDALTKILMRKRDLF